MLPHGVNRLVERANSLFFENFVSSMELLARKEVRDTVSTVGDGFTFCT